MVFAALSTPTSSPYQVYERAPWAPTMPALTASAAAQAVSAANATFPLVISPPCSSVRRKFRHDFPAVSRALQLDCQRTQHASHAPASRGLVLPSLVRPRRAHLHGSPR